ncbi:allantoinase [Alicyclobacillus pomorum]|uniref:allantoinase n=1 Tax=Alicyclobacillus pomorum TaxID=204470 RepID=UPI00041A3504|nr:allantoinase [Alicyclobacillus pomorum]
MSEHYDLIVRNGCVVNENYRFYADIGVREGRIVRIEEHLPDSVKARAEIDATGLYIFPGLIDTHVHFNQPGRTEWEGFAYGSRSLAAGGVTTFFDMPLNAHPPTNTVQAFDLKKQAADRESMLDCRLWGGLVPGNLDSLEGLYQRGVIGFKAFMSASGIEDFERVDDSTLLKGMQKIAKLNSILAVHAESDFITRHLTDIMQKSGRQTARDYCLTRPILSEIEAVRRVIAYAEITGCKLHIVHASCSPVVAVVTEAKSRGVDVSVETCPHYLSLTVEDFERIGGVAKCAPPLRDQEHVELLWRSVANGEVDIIGSDHSPSPVSLKNIGSDNMFEAWGGISGAQTTLNILLEEGHRARKLPLEAIVRLTSANPARRFGLFPQKGIVALGSDADLTLVDLNASFKLESADLFYRHPHSPYLGKTFHGKVVYTVQRGRILYENGRFLEEVSLSCVNAVTDRSAPQSIA